MNTRRFIITFTFLLCLFLYPVLCPARADSKAVITTQPRRVEVACHYPFSLTVEAAGGSLSYQWQYRTGDSVWTDWQNMTTPSITPTAIPEMNDWEIRCVIANSAGSVVSDTVRVSALPRIVMYNWPNLSNLTAGETVSLRIDGYGQEITYQWYLSSDRTIWQKWEGQTGPVCEFTVSPEYNGKYIDCRITDKHGQTKSAAEVYGDHRMLLSEDIDCEEERTIWFLEDDAYAEYVGSIPAGFPQQLDYSGQDVKLISGETVTVENGIVAPNGTTWYYQGGGGTTFPLTGEGVEVITEYEEGDSVISVNGRIIKIHVADYCLYYADKVIEDYIRENITDMMTERQKAAKICEFICARDYDVQGQDWVAMATMGHGDCWASTSTILYMARKVGIQAMRNDERGKNGAGSGHMNAVALLDGQYCVLEAGYNGKAPRSYSITAYGDPFDYNVKASSEAGINTYMNFDQSTAVTIPAELDGYKITSIDYRAFSGHDEITSLTIPETVTTIESQAFLNCSGLTAITIPASVTSMSSDAFFGCSSLSAIRVEEGNPVYKSIDGIVFSRDGTTLIAFPSGRKGTYTIPSSVTIISAKSFSDAKLDCLILPENMKTIEERTFASSSIQSFILPKGLKRIETGAFYRADAKTFTLPQGLEHIGEGAFNGIISLRVTIPSSVSEIGPYAFAYCSSSLIVFSEGCDPVIGEGAFTSSTISVQEGTGPWQYAADNNVTYRLQDESGRIPLQSDWLELKRSVFTCSGKPVEFLDYLENPSLMSIQADCDFYISATEYIKPGKGTMTISGIGNYTGSIAYDYEIRLYDMNGDGILDSRDLIDYYYGQEVLKNTLILPKGLREIETGAFAGVHPKAVIIPQSVQRIGKDAFDSDEGMIVVIPDESWISWAVQKGYDYRINIDR